MCREYFPPVPILHKALSPAPFIYSLRLSLFQATASDFLLGVISVVDLLDLDIFGEYSFAFVLVKECGVNVALNYCAVVNGNC